MAGGPGQFSAFPSIASARCTAGACKHCHSNSSLRGVPGCGDHVTVTVTVAVTVTVTLFFFFLFTHCERLAMRQHCAQCDICPSPSQAHKPLHTMCQCQAPSLFTAGCPAAARLLYTLSVCCVPCNVQLRLPVHFVCCQVCPVGDPCP